MSIMKKEFVLTIIFKEEVKKYSLEKEKAENLLKLIISENKAESNFDEEKNEIVNLVKSSTILSVECSDNRIVIKLE